MGIGDELMAAGQARQLREQSGKNVVIVDQYGRVRQHDLWLDNPDVSRWLRANTLRLRNCSGHRPYIAAKSPAQWTWKDFTPTPARIVLREGEEEFGRRHAGKILIEPNVKQQQHDNKQWIWARWQELADRHPGRFVQVGHGDFRRLSGVEILPTPSFRLACAVLKNSLAYVGPEGALHHAAAAFGIPAVVLFGGFISPAQTGYSTHHNLFTGGKPCGRRVPCAHCRQAMEAITVDMVDQHLSEALNEAG